MKKISLLLILLCSYLSFAQLENYPITYVGLIYSSDIRGVDNVLTVPQGKVWKVISGRTISIVAPNSGERFISSFIRLRNKNYNYECKFYLDEKYGYTFRVSSLH